VVKIYHHPQYDLDAHPRTELRRSGPALLGIFFCLAAFACPWPTVPMPSHVSIELLNFGRLLWQNSQRSGSEREETKIKKAEEQLIVALNNEPSTILRAILNYSTCTTGD
jgi:hypothetical protein